MRHHLSMLPFRGLLRWITTIISLIFVWIIIHIYSGIPAFLFPSPQSVGQAVLNNQQLLWHATQTTFIETFLGLFLGCFLGGSLALLMILSSHIRHWLMPIVLVSQAIPVFALAPLLVLWFGFGVSSKIAMAVLVIFFPITSAFFDGLCRTPTGWLDMAQTMRTSKLRFLCFIQIPAALPSFASGLRVATAIAPIGAVVGEWVGASSGLGFLMQAANNRFQTDLMFAALLILSLMTMILWGVVNFILKKLIPWAVES